MNVCVCVGCGCDDESPCPGGCSWLRIDVDEQLGVCSSCPSHVARFDAGDLEPTEEAMEAFAARAGESEDDDPGLILPGDTEFDNTLAFLRRR